jgi:uroporphyrinogen-III synthase
VSETSERDVILLSSVDAVEAWLTSALELPVVALGDEVSAALEAANRAPVFTLRGACTEALLEAQVHLSGRRVFLPIAAGSQTTLREPLSALGATPVIVPISGYQISMPAPWPAHVDLIALPSSLAALSLYAQASSSISSTPVVAIGPRSAAQATACGASDVRTAAADTIDSLVATVVEFFSTKPRPTADEPLRAELGGVP